MGCEPASVSGLQLEDCPSVRVEFRLGERPSCRSAREQDAGAEVRVRLSPRESRTCENTAGMSKVLLVCEHFQIVPQVLVKPF